MGDAVYPLCKLSSQSARVLNDRECPAHDTTHSISDYPVYYQFHPEVFESPESVSAWLSIFLLPALAVVFGRQVTVHVFPTSDLVGHCVIVNGVLEGAILCEAIVQRVFCAESVWDYVALPAWFRSPSCHFIDSLDRLTLPALKVAIRFCHSSAEFEH
jgi:hypothetical protein